MKREIMEMVSNAYAVDPMAERKDVCQAVAKELESRPDLMERVREVSVFHMLETVVGEYVRRTRSRIKNAIEGGQEDAGMDAPPPYEAIAKVRLTIPVGNGRYEDKPALMCDFVDVRAARDYYAKQRDAIDTRHAYCMALEKAMRNAGLDHGETVARLYAA
jgi:hypothetical protein